MACIMPAWPWLILSMIHDSHLSRSCGLCMHVLYVQSCTIISCVCLSASIFSYNSPPLIALSSVHVYAPAHHPLLHHHKLLYLRILQTAPPLASFVPEIYSCLHSRKFHNFLSPSLSQFNLHFVPSYIYLDSPHSTVALFLLYTVIVTSCAQSTPYAQKFSFYTPPVGLSIAFCP